MAKKQPKADECYKCETKWPYYHTLIIKTRASEQLFRLCGRCTNEVLNQIQS